MRASRRIFLSLLVLAMLPASTSAEAAYKTLKTRYATVYYKDDKDISDFIWRIGGARIDFPAEKTLASNRIDRIVERVETILDMYPKNFKVKIYLERGPLQNPNEVAYCERKTQSIYISVDHASDGVLAHEIAHAVINQYFPITTSSKIEEILTQYVDKYLWSDY